MTKHDEHTERILKRASEQWCCGQPDCAERILCPKVGGVGHWQCGICPDHNLPRHFCACTQIEPLVDEAKPASEETPDEGHTWRITVECRGSHSVVGDEHATDSKDFDGIPISFEVREWSLAAGLAKASRLPFSVLTADMVTHEEALDAAEAEGAQG